MSRLKMAVVVSGILGLAFCSAAGEMNIGDFEQDTQNWKLNLGKEFPGVIGEMALDSSTAQKGKSSLILTADFSGGGIYIGAMKYLKLTDKIKSIEFWIKSPDQNKLNFRIIDAKNQTHHLNMTIPQSPKWQKVIIDKFNKNSKGQTYVKWGGPKDGVFYQPIKKIEIIVPKTNVQRVVVWLDEIKINMVVTSDKK